MTLTPELALAYLKELSADYRAGVVLDAAGTVLAGVESLAAPARELWRRAAVGSVCEGVARDGRVFAYRTPTLAIVVATGPFALPGLTRHDLRTVAAALGAESAQETPVQRIPHDYVEALLNAAN